MDEKQLADLLKYSSPNELWVVTWNNLLKILITPFKVVVKQDVGNLKTGQVVMVQQVKVTLELKTVYIIKGVAFFYSHFEILDEEE